VIQEEHKRARVAQTSGVYCPADSRCGAVEQLDDLEVVINGRCLGQVDRHCVDRHFGPRLSIPEWLQGVGSLVVADEDYGTAFQVQDDHHEPMVLGDGDLKEVLQLAFGVAADKLPLLHVLDDVSRGRRRTTLVAPGACLMAISRNARTLPDFPEFAQQLGMVSPELPSRSFQLTKKTG